jgi:hypothetical protein
MLNNFPRWYGMIVNPDLNYDILRLKHDPHIFLDRWHGDTALHYAVKMHLGLVPGGRRDMSGVVSFLCERGGRMLIEEKDGDGAGVTALQLVLAYGNRSLVACLARDEAQALPPPGGAFGYLLPPRAARAGFRLP